MSLTLVSATGQTTSAPTRTPKIPDSGLFVFKSDEAGESVMENTSAPITQPNAVRYAVGVVSDVFKNTPANPASGQRKDGKSILIQINETWKLYDPANTALAPIYLPVQAHMVLRFPVDESITSTELAALVDRLVGAATRDDEQTLASALDPLLHGITKF